MNFDAYMEFTRSTAVYPHTEANSYPVLGLVGETGEVAELTKKVIRDNTEMNLEALALELGDVLWYLARIIDEYGFSFDDIAQRNIAKLQSRQQRNVLGGSGDYR